MKTLLLAAAAALSLATASAAHGAELWIVASDEHHFMLADADSIVSVNDGMRRMTSFMVSDDFGTLDSGARPAYATTTWEFDCVRHRRREMSLSFADRNWNVLGSSEEVQPWDPVVADSNGESELNFACGHRDDDATRAAGDDFNRLAPMLLQELERGGGPTAQKT